MISNFSVVLNDAKQTLSQLLDRNRVSSAEESIRVTNEIITSITNVETGSHEIENIIGLINSISDQTNLQALNAAIGADRGQ